MKVALGQINTAAADVAGNLNKTKSCLQAARERGAHLLVLPELALPGYPPLDYLKQSEFVERCETAVDDLAAAAGDLDVLVGHVAASEDGLYNAASLLSGGRRVATHRKTVLPPCPTFNEAHYFAPGGGFEPLEIDGFRLGVTISDDLWDSKHLRSRGTAEGQTGARPNWARVDVLVNLAAAPFRSGSTRARLQALRRAGRAAQAPVIFANLVGGNDSTVFDGGSLALDAEGRIIKAADRFREDLLILDTDRTGDREAPDPADDTGDLRRALVLALSDYAAKCSFRKAVLGLSGGIDSSVVACLAAEALGPEHVTGLIMPSVHSSEGSSRDAEALGEALGIECVIIPIEPVRRSFEDALAPAFGDAEPDATEENIQARIRGTLVMAYSNKFGHLPLATGNRSELAVGYCTLYGDMVGALAPLGDVPKTTVYELAHHVNREDRVIPEAVMQKPPSAELRPGQRDQDELPPYEELDGLLHDYLAEHRGPRELIRSGADEQTVADVLNRVARTEFKRRQGPLVPLVTSGGAAFPVARGPRDWN